MRYFKYGCLSIGKNILFTFIMVLEVAALLVTSNVMIGSMNSKQALAVPFYDIVDKDGYYGCFEPMYETTEEYYEYYSYFDKLKSATVLWYDENDAGKIVDDEIFFKYCMPLKSGSWPKTGADESGRPYVVVSPDYLKEPGDTISVDGVGECVVSGVLTDVTYIPSFGFYGESDDEGNETAGNGATEFYRSADYETTIAAIKAGSKSELDYSDSAIIFSQSAYAAAYDGEYEKYGLSCFILYDDDISAADKEYNSDIIKQITEYKADEEGYTEPELTSLSDIKAATDEYVKDSYINILPIILVVAAIVLIGLIGSVAINTVTQIKNYGVYYLCGARWGDCLKIAFANILVILLFSGLLSAAVLYAASFFDLNYLIGQVYNWNNLYASVGIITAMLILSLIIPFGIIRFTSPVDVIKNKK